MKALKLVSLAAVLLLAGCASNPMQVSSTTTVEPPAAAKSQVVFMRDTFVGSAISASLYDVTADEPVFIGIINNGTKVVYEATPGKHRYMVVSEAADFMEADLAASKTYYSMVTPRMGMWKARFSLWPVKTSAGAEISSTSQDFINSQKNTKVANTTDKAKAWFQSNKSSVIEKQKEYLTVWQQKSQADLAKRTLSPEDGM